MCRARDALKSTLPDTLRDPSFANAIRNEESVQKWLSALLVNVGDPVAPGEASGKSSLSSKFPPAPPAGSGALSEQQFSSTFNPIASVSQKS